MIHVGEESQKVTVSPGEICLTDKVSLTIEILLLGFCQFCHIYVEAQAPINMSIDVFFLDVHRENGERNTIRFFVILAFEFFSDPWCFPSCDFWQDRNCDVNVITSLVSHCAKVGWVYCLTRRDYKCMIRFLSIGQNFGALSKRRDGSTRENGWFLVRLNRSNSFC